MPGKMQFGSGWWFNDQKDGMERQMTQLAQLGLLSRFVGMLTDSRSFLSLHPPRILPPYSVPDDRPLGGCWRSACGYRAAGRDGEKTSALTMRVITSPLN